MSSATLDHVAVVFAGRAQAAGYGHRIRSQGKDTTKNRTLTRKGCGTPPNPSKSLFVELAQCRQGCATALWVSETRRSHVFCVSSCVLIRFYFTIDFVSRHVYTVSMSALDYRKMYEDLCSKIRELAEQRTDLEVRLGDITKEIESLEQTTRHLSGLAGYGPNEPDDISNLGITEAVRSVLDPNARMSTAEIKAKMEQQGFDFSRYSAPDASIRTTLKRLVEAKRAEVEKEGYNTFYKLLYTDEEIPF